MNLTEILNKINEARPNAEMDLNMVDPNTYRARVGLKQAAIQNLKYLKVDYRNEVMKTVAFIVVTGSNRESFTQLATADTFGCLSADPDQFFADLTSRINPTLFGREGLRQLFNIAGNILEDKAIELDLGSYNMLQFSEKYNRGIKTADEFKLLIKEAINDQIGSEIVGINAVHSVVDNAISKGYSGAVTPILLTTDDEKFALDLTTNLKRRQLADGTYRGLTKNVFLVVAGKSSKTLPAVEGLVSVKKVSEETVAESLSIIRNNIA